MLDDLLDVALDIIGDVAAALFSAGRKKKRAEGGAAGQSRPMEPSQKKRDPDQEPWEQADELPPWEK